MSKSERAAVVAAELEGSRVAFRDVTNRTNSRTVLTCLVPPQTFLTNKAPYLAFAAGGDLERAACLGLMNSLAFDWQARRFVETNVNFFILEGLRIPALSDEAVAAIGRAAARLSCPDKRFARFAAHTGVELGPLTQSVRDSLRVEIDAQVAVAWDLNDADLAEMFSDFTLDAIPLPYRDAVCERVASLRGSPRTATAHE